MRGSSDRTSGNCNRKEREDPRLKQQSQEECWQRREIRPPVQDRMLGFPAMTSCPFTPVEGRCEIRDDGDLLPTPPRHCLNVARHPPYTVWMLWPGNMAVADRMLSWGTGRAQARPRDAGSPFRSCPPFFGWSWVTETAALDGREMGLRQLQITVQQRWHSEQPFFFFLGWKIVRMASSKTALRPFCVRAEHSR